MSVIDIFRTCYSRAAEYAFFSSIHGIFSQINYISGQKISLIKFNGIEIISRIFCNHHGMKSEINYKKKTEQHTFTWRLINMILMNK